MSFRIRYCNSNHIVRLIYFERVDMLEHRNSIRQIVERYGRLKPLRILVDKRLAKFAISAMEHRALGRYAAGLEPFKHAKIALLLPKDYNAASLFTTAAQAHGLQVVEFIGEQGALRWLNKSPLPIS